MKLRKTVIAWLLSLCLIVTMTPAFAFAGGPDQQLGTVSFEEIMGGDNLICVKPGEEITVAKFKYDGKSAIVFSAACKNYESDNDIVIDEDEATPDLVLELYGPTSNYMGGSRWFAYGEAAELYYSPGQSYPGSGEMPNLISGKTYEIKLYNDSSEFVYYVDFDVSAGEYGYAETASYPGTAKVKAGEWTGVGFLPEISDTVPLIDSVYSDNESILKVMDRGFFVDYFGIKKGKTKVNVTLEGGYTFTIKVEVKNGKPVLDQSEFSLNRGSKLKLRVLYNSNKARWSTSNKKVAKVSKKGVVTAVEPGACYITAKVSGMKAKCYIEVYRYNPDFGVEFQGYNYDKKTLTLRFVNNGVKSMTIYSAGASYLDFPDDIQVNRNLKLSKKSIKIPVSGVKDITFKFKKGSFDWVPTSPYVY
ncbi:MAG: Ig-like domain-containing protein, partial [Bacillota bacterium]|nr:Ig-like domain-containing protein [Bacillota bacterium]